MDIIAFQVEEKTNKKGKVYYALYGLTKDGSKYFIQFVSKHN